MRKAVKIAGSLAVLAVMFGIDRAVKLWVVAEMPLYSQRRFLPGLIGLYHVRNNGMAFGLLPDTRWLLIAITLVVAAGVIWGFAKGMLTTHRLLFCSVITISGGALGNFFDRALHGYVVDMFEFEFIKGFAIFNVADVFITLGGVMLCVYLLFFHRESVEITEAVEKREEGSESTDGDI